MRNKKKKLKPIRELSVLYFEIDGYRSNRFLCHFQKQLTRCIALLFSFFIVENSCSQINAYRQYTSKNGLPSSEVYDIVQDDFGFIWFSTDKGVSRYNGYEFENFDETDGLPQHVVFDFLKLPNGEIWCTTLSGELFTISGYHPTFEKYQYNHLILKEVKPTFGPVNSLYVAPTGKVYVSFKSTNNLLIIDKNGVMNDLHPAVDLEQKQVFLHTMFEDGSEPFFFKSIKNGQFMGKKKTSSHFYHKNELVGASISEALTFESEKTAVFLFDANFVIKSPKQKTKRISCQPQLIASGKLSNSLFWTGHKNGGVVIYNTKGQKVDHLLKSETVTQLMVDDQYNYWVATADHGVFIVNSLNIKQLNLDEKTNERIHSIESDGSQLFVGSYYGSIFKLISSRNSSRIAPYSLKQPVSIYYCGENSTTYFSSDYSFDNKSEIVSKYSSFTPHANGKKTAALRYSDVVLTDLKTKKQQKIPIPHRSSAICFLNDRLFLGTHKGLYVLNNNRFEKVKTFGNWRINQLVRMNNTMAICTNGQGIVVFSPEKGIQSHLTTKNGLSSNFVSNVYIENSKELWCSSNVGVDKITLGKNPKVKSVDLQNFLPSNEISDLSLFKDTLWIATKSGLCFVPKKIVDSETKELNLHLNFSAIFVGGVQYDLHQKERLYHDQNEIEFQFGAIAFVNLSDLRYRYKLVGIDRNWRTTNLRSVNYSALPSGNFTFIVQVKSKNGSWEKNEQRISFKIALPFWKTWWFILAAFFAVVFLIYLFFKYRILSYNQHIIKEILRHLLKRIRRKTLMVQVKHLGKSMKIESSKIHFVKSDGNYLEIHTTDRVYLHRASFDLFISDLPDAIEYMRVHRSFLVRIDNIQGKSKTQVILLNQEIPVGRKYWNDVANI